MQYGKCSEGIGGLMKSQNSAARRTLGTLLLAMIVIFAFAYPASRLGFFEWPRKYDPFAIPDMRQAPGLLTDWQMKLVDAEEQNCLAAFALAGQPQAPRPARGVGTQCEVAGAITLSRLSTARIRPEEMRCPVAARLYIWERHHLQPAATRILGEPIAEVLHFGSYSCRTMRRGTSMSEHATANAFDISGFRTASGKLITVKGTWGKPGKEGNFLRAAHDGLCDWFNLTLGPDYNADHADHFHVDMGWWRSCR